MTSSMLKGNQETRVSRGVHHRTSPSDSVQSRVFQPNWSPASRRSTASAATADTPPPSHRAWALRAMRANQTTTRWRLGRGRRPLLLSTRRVVSGGAYSKMGCSGMMWCGVVWCGLVRNGMVRYGVEWNGVEWCGMEWNVVARCGMEWCGVE